MEVYSSSLSKKKKKKKKNCCNNYTYLGILFLMNCFIIENLYNPILYRSKKKKGNYHYFLPTHLFLYCWKEKLI